MLLEYRVELKLMDTGRVAILASAWLALVLAWLLAQADVTNLYSLGDALFALHDMSIISLALPVAFSRVAMPASPAESLQWRIAVGLLLATVALINKHLLLDGRASSYGMLLASQVASYIVAARWGSATRTVLVTCFSLGLTYWVVQARRGILAIRISSTLLFARCASQLAGPPSRFSLTLQVALAMVGFAFAPMLVPVLNQCLPTEEIATAYAAVSTVVSSVAGHDTFYNSATEMLIVMANIQIPLGYQSIEFLRSVQDRQNALLTVGKGASLSANEYVLRARRWVLLVCFPYLLQKTIMTSIQSHTFARFRHWTERSLRLHSFFPQEGHSGTTLKAAANSNYTVEQYADAINGAVENAFAIISAKLFSLPKVLLVPGVVVAKPWLMVAVVPASVLLDTSKAWITAHLTAEVELLHRQLLELANKRRRIELHDMKNEELLQRAHASSFVQRQWRQVGDQIEDRGMRLKAVQLLHSIADQLYRQQVLGPGIECTLAFLMETNYISSSDIYLYTTVLEHAIDTVLTRQREQATLASMQTKVSLVRHLTYKLLELRSQKRPRCTTTESSQALSIKSLEYVRGQAHVQIPSLILPAGRVVAVTGPNGCGKSTALAFVASCRGSWTPTGAELLADAVLELPSGDVVEIGQQFYRPMFTSPMSWLLFGRLEGRNIQELRGLAQRLLKEFGLIRASDLQGMVLPGSLDSMDALDQVKEDWYSELSGGERCKVEFIQKVFLRQECPPVLLIDEAFAPLDPASSHYLKVRLKAFCRYSVVLVVYHGSESLDDSFFDDELQFAHGTAILRQLH